MRVEINRKINTGSGLKWNVVAAFAVRQDAIVTGPFYYNIIDSTLLNTHSDYIYKA